MPILFRPDMVPLILSGCKTVTRRRGKKRWNVDAIHQAWTKRGGPAFARVLIVSVNQEAAPGSPDGLLMSDRWLTDESRYEGFAFWPDFEAAYVALNGGDPKVLRQPCWRVEFEVVTEDA